MATQQTDINMTIKDVNLTITFCDKDSEGVSMLWSTDDIANNIMNAETSSKVIFHNSEEIENVGTFERDFRWIKYILPENWKKGQEVWIGLKVNTDYCCHWYYQPVGRGLPFLKIDSDGFLHMQRHDVYEDDMKTTYEKCNCKYNFEVEESNKSIPIKKICHYVAQRGPKKGEICGSNFTRQGSYCYKHKKFEKK